MQQHRITMLVLVVAVALAALSQECGVEASSPVTCKEPVMAELRYNISGRLASQYLPFVFPPGTSLPQVRAMAACTHTHDTRMTSHSHNFIMKQALCCDAWYEGFAEPRGFYARPTVDLFAILNASAVTTFYDPTCGVPLFRAPLGRSFAAFKADTEAHGWPSFRDPEVNVQHVKVQSDGSVMSSCGTHLGTYVPDAGGSPRYCIDLTCVSGHPLP